MNLLMVDTRDSEVKCPHCQEKMRKITYVFLFQGLKTSRMPK